MVSARATPQTLWRSLQRSPVYFSCIKSGLLLRRRGEGKGRRRMEGNGRKTVDGGE